MVSVVQLLTLRLAATLSSFSLLARLGSSSLGHIRVLSVGVERRRLDCSVVVYLDAGSVHFY